jgi:hypothetical protein
VSDPAAERQRNFGAIDRSTWEAEQSERSGYLAGKMRAYRRDEDVDRIGFAVFVRHAMNETHRRPGSA